MGFITWPDAKCRCWICDSVYFAEVMQKTRDWIKRHPLSDVLKEDPIALSQNVYVNHQGLLTL